MNLSKSLIITGTLLNFMLRVSNAYTSEYCKTFNTINGEHINDYRMPLHDCLISFTLPFNCLECTDIFIYLFFFYFIIRYLHKVKRIVYYIKTALIKY